MKNLKELRKLTGLNQEAFAKLIGVTHGSMRQIESKHLSVSPERLLTISEETGCGLDYGPGYPGQSGRTMASVHNAPKPIGIKLTQREIFKDGRFSIPMSDDEEISFTKEYFESYRAKKDPLKKVGELWSSLEGLRKHAFDGLVEKCSQSMPPDEIQGVLYAIFERMVDSALEAASSSREGKESLVDYIRNEEGWSVDYPDADPKEFLGSWLRDRVSEVDFKMLSSLRADSGGTSPQN